MHVSFHATESWQKSCLALHWVSSKHFGLGINSRRFFHPRKKFPREGQTLRREGGVSKNFKTRGGTLLPPRYPGSLEPVLSTYAPYKARDWLTTTTSLKRPPIHTSRTHFTHLFFSRHHNAIKCLFPIERFHWAINLVPRASPAKK